MRADRALGIGSGSAAAMASLAPLSTSRPSAVRTPLVRVSARNGMSSAMDAVSVARPAASALPAGAPSSARRARARSTTERPSGVSSWMLHSSAAVSTSTSVTPGAAEMLAARRLP